VWRPGGTIGLLSWTPEGIIGSLFRTMGPFAPPPPPGATPPPRWGSEQHLEELFGNRVAFGEQRRDVLEVTEFSRPEDFAAHFKTLYGPTIATLANANRNGREAEFLEAFARVYEDADIGTPGAARFEMEYLLSVGKRA
jgi:hypothetical protein